VLSIGAAALLLIGLLLVCSSFSDPGSGIMHPPGPVSRVILVVLVLGAASVIGIDLST
jgi:hypothetical protein